MVNVTVGKARKLPTTFPIKAEVKVTEEQIEAAKAELLAYADSKGYEVVTQEARGPRVAGRNRSHITVSINVREPADDAEAYTEDEDGFADTDA